MNREVHVRSCERLAGEVPPAYSPFKFARFGASTQDDNGFLRGQFLENDLFDGTAITVNSETKDQ
jgi:hypothetical protein